jgi:hypothetical protein
MCHRSLSDALKDRDEVSSTHELYQVSCLTQSHSSRRLTIDGNVGSDALFKCRYDKRNYLLARGKNSLETWRNPFAAAISVL